MPDADELKGRAILSFALAQCLLHPPSFRDIVDERYEPACLPIDQVWDVGDVEAPKRAVTEGEGHLVARRLSGEHLPEVWLGDRHAGGIHHVANRHPEQLVGRPAGPALVGPVDELVPQVAVDVAHERGQGLDDGAQQPVTLADLPFRVLAQTKREESEAARGETDYPGFEPGAMSDRNAKRDPYRTRSSGDQGRRSVQ